MTSPDPLLDGGIVLLFAGVLTIAAAFLGRYIFHIFSGTYSHGIVGHLESGLYRFIGTSPEKEGGWREYARDMLMFNAMGLLVLLVLLLAQGVLPFNPEGIGGFSPYLAINAAISFVTNTNWQVYSGETSASYLIQMAGFTVQNFLSAATGIAIAIAVMRGITRRTTDRIGNFWVDVTRTIVYILLPLAFIAAIILVSQGVIQNLDPYIPASGYGPAGPQQIAMGPVASQEAIKEIGTNGGGFFNANSAHPFENPNSFTNILEIFLMLLIPAALPITFGLMARDPRQGWALYAVMLILYLSAFGIFYAAEMGGNPLLEEQGAAGISMEGKEVRFGLGGTVLFSTSTTAASCGAVNAMHDSLTPLGGLVPMLLILLGEVVFGGVGSGFYTIIAFVIIAVFIAGLMIGRTPEYLGKKIEVREMQMAVVAVLTPGILVLILTAAAMVVPGAISAILNPGPHGLSEILYAFASMSNNNGSAFAGLDSTHPFYALAGALAMAIGRFVPAVALLSIGGSMAEKKIVPPSFGTLPTASPAFIFWLILIILIIGVLSFFPLFAMGPIAEYFIMQAGV